MKKAEKIDPALVQSHKDHRKRLRERFNKSGLAGFHDYEIIELLLTLGTPQGDVKVPAKEAIARFKTLRGVLEAPLEELRRIKGIGPINSIAIRIVQEAAREFLKEKLPEKPVNTSADDILRYLYHSMRDLKKEVFKVLFLNSRNQIIETEDMFEGTVNSSAVSPREVVEGALKHNAVSVIFAHNHPSGSPEPSKADKDITRDLVYAVALVNIKVLDHLVIGDNQYYSFAGHGMIEEFELDFLRMKRSMETTRGKAEISSGGLPWAKEQEQKEAF
jgi:DNA repair protein RadC